MGDNNFLIASKQLRQNDLNNFLVDLLNNNFTGLLSSYSTNNGFFGNGIVYSTGSDQLISGNKSFYLNPNVPYSGGTGSAPSKLFVTDQDTILQNQLNVLVNLMHLSGIEFVSGSKNFNNIIITSGVATGIFEVAIPKTSSGALPLWYFTQQTGLLAASLGVDSYLHKSGVGAETVSGVKTFSDGVYIPSGTNISGGIPLCQLDSSGNSIISQFNNTGINLQTQLSNLVVTVANIDLSQAASVTGYGGVLSVNAQSGNLFLQGRGNTTVTTNGNVINISGNTLDGYTGMVAGYVNLISGFDRQFIGYGQTFPSAPRVFTQLVNNFGNPHFTYDVSGQNTSGFNVIFSNTILNSGYSLNFWATTGTGSIINVIQGPQGLSGLEGIQGIQGDPGVTPTNFNYNINYYSQIISTGLEIYEQFVNHQYVLTDLSVGITQSGSGIPLTGNLYTRTPTNTKTTLFGFSLNSGMYFSGINLGFDSIAVDSSDRIGIDLTRSISGARGLTITVGGYLVP